MSLAGTDWLFTLGAALLAAAGVMLLLWALCGDRVRAEIVYRKSGTRRRRCPKCWYDMAGVRGLRCPECGREAKSERGLRRGRRSLRGVLVAAALLLCAHAMRLTPQVRSRGWWAAAPSWLLIGLFDPRARPGRGGAILSLDDPFAPASARIVRTAALTLEEELNHRLGRDRRILDAEISWLGLRCAGAIGSDQGSSRLSNGFLCFSRLSSSGLLRGRGLAGALDRLEPALATTRSEWVAGAPVCVRLKQPAWLASRELLRYLIVECPDVSPFGAETLVQHGAQPLPVRRREPWVDGVITLGVAPNGLTELRLRIRLEEGSRWGVGPRRVLWRRTERLPIIVHDAVDDAMTPVADEDVTATLAALQPHVHVWSNNSMASSVHLDGEGLSSMLHSKSLTLGVRLEVIDERGETLERTERWMGGAPSPRTPNVELMLSGLDPDHPDRGLGPIPLSQPTLQAFREGAPLRVRITSAPHIALRDFGSRQRWEGEVILPIDPKERRLQGLP